MAQEIALRADAFGLKKTGIAEGSKGTVAVIVNTYG